MHAHHYRPIWQVKSCLRVYVYILCPENSLMEIPLCIHQLSNHSLTVCLYTNQKWCKQWWHRVIGFSTRLSAYDVLWNGRAMAGVCVSLVAIVVNVVRWGHRDHERWLFRQIWRKREVKLKNLVFHTWWATICYISGGLREMSGWYFYECALLKINVLKLIY